MDRDRAPVTGLSSCRYEDIFKTFDSRTNDFIHGEIDPATKALFTSAFEYGFEGILAQLAEFKRDALTLLQHSDKNEGILHAVSDYFDGLSKSQKRFHIEFTQVVGNMAPSPQYFTFDKYLKDKANSSDTDNFMNSNFNSLTSTSKFRTNDSPQPFDEMPSPKDSPTRQRVTFGPEDREGGANIGRELVLKPIRDDLLETQDHRRIIDVQTLLDLVRPNRSREGSKVVPDIPPLEGVRDSQDMSPEIVTGRDSIHDQHNPYTASPPPSFYKPQKEFTYQDSQYQQQISDRIPEVSAPNTASKPPQSVDHKKYRFGARDENVPGGFVLSGWSTSITAVARNESLYSFEFVDTSKLIRLNLHTGVCEKFNHHLGRVLNYRRVGDYEIFFLFCNHIVVLKDRVLRHICEYQLIPDYHSRGVLTQTTTARVGLFRSDARNSTSSNERTRPSLSSILT